MRGQISVAGLLAVGVVAAGLFSIAPVTDAASAAQSAKKSRESARNYVLESKRRRHRRARGPRIPLPVGPAYIYYDYPYYYSRGHYPTHIGGYVYYIPKSQARCAHGHRKCVTRGRSSASSRR